MHDTVLVSTASEASLSLGKLFKSNGRITVNALVTLILWLVAKSIVPISEYLIRAFSHSKLVGKFKGRLNLKGNECSPASRIVSL